MDLPALTLYYSPFCYYCIKVLRAISTLGAQVHMVNVREQPEARQMLYDRRGRGTVPVLGIRKAPDADEELMGESDDIIRYLRDLYA